MSRSTIEKKASATIYLVEELGDARLLCDQLQRHVERAVTLIEKSEQKDHFFEVAGDLIQAIPETTRKLFQALQAVALATNRLDYEEVKQTLRPEKADELENVLDDVRIRPVRRRGTPMEPAEAIQHLRDLAATTQKTGSLPLTAALQFLAELEAGDKTAAADVVASDLGNLADALENPPEGVEGPSRLRLAAVLRQVIAKSLTEDVLTAHRVVARVAAKELDIRELNALKKSLEDILVEARKNHSKEIESLAQKALKTVKIASDDVFGAKTAMDKTRAMEKIVGVVEDQIKELKAAYTKFKADPGKNAPQLRNFESAINSISSAFRIFERSVKTASEKSEMQDLLKQHGYDPKDVTKLMKDDIGPEELKSRLKNKPGQMGSLEYTHNLKKKASDDEKESRYEEGEPADPTENMSPEDAAKWKENTEEHKDDFKKEAGAILEGIQSTLGIKKNLTEAYSAGTEALPDKDLHEQELDNAISEVIRIVKLTPRTSFRSLIFNLLPSLWEVAYYKGALDSNSKTASADEKESRYEEGKPADPTENMSPEDAAKWKENTEEYGDKLKKKASMDPSVMRSLEILAKDHKGMVKAQPNSFQVLFSASLPNPEGAARAFARDAVMEYPVLRGGVGVQEVAGGRWFVSLDNKRLSKMASGPDLAEQYKLMKAHPPKLEANGDKFTIEIYSPFAGKYITQAEWDDKKVAEADLRSWEKSHKDTVFRLKQWTKVARYEEGKPADPTENMSPEDAAKWKENTEEYGDLFKSAMENPWKVDASEKVAYGGVGDWLHQPSTSTYQAYFHVFDLNKNGGYKAVRVDVGPTGRASKPVLTDLRPGDVPIIRESEVPPVVKQRAEAAAKEWRAKLEDAAAKAQQERQQLPNVSPPATPSKSEIMTLFILMGYKPAGRDRQMRYKGLGAYGLSNINIASLVKRGIVVVRGANAIMVDKPKAMAFLVKNKDVFADDPDLRTEMPYSLRDQLR